MRQALIITLLVILSILAAYHVLVVNPTNEAIRTSQTESPTILKPLVVIYVF